MAKKLPSRTSKTKLKVSNALIIPVAIYFSKKRVVGGPDFGSLPIVKEFNDFHAVCQDRDAMCLDKA